ncbi:MAG: hypothetical protein COB50_05345 [Thiotrichales bacterium]|nr:MAG: hypothetical protein COB50_05345 [Thiotrichales bacterium]
MKPLRIRLEKVRHSTGIPWDVLERDYLLSWILVGISQNKVLRDSIVFKGRTALKKCYFGNYRFSEDLDFSSLPNTPKGEKLEKAIHDACRIAEELLNEYAPVRISCERYMEK